MKILPKRVAILFDTNSVHPGKDAIDYFKLGFDFAKKYPFELDLIFPEVVFKERLYQIKQRSEKEYLNLEKSTKYFGQDFNKTLPELIKMAESKFIEEISDKNITIYKPDYSRIDLEKIVNNSIDRISPFSLDGEKGFRDFIIMETVDQWSNNIPSDIREYRIIIISNDNLLFNALSEKFSNNSNFLIKRNTSECLEYLSKLSSGLPNTIVDNILFQAQDIFLGENYETGLYVDSGKRDKVMEDFKKEICEIPQSLYTWFDEIDFFCGESVLADIRDDKCFYFFTNVEYQGNLFFSTDGDSLSGFHGLLGDPFYYVDLGDNCFAVLLVTACISFEVSWEAILDNKKLKLPKINGIKPVMRRSFERGFKFNGYPYLLGYSSRTDGLRVDFCKNKSFRKVPHPESLNEMTKQMVHNKSKPIFEDLIQRQRKED